MLTNAQRYGVDGSKALGLHPDIITREDYNELQARMARYEGWYASIGKPRSYRAEDVPPNARLSNEERSAIEVYEWVMYPPVRAFVYVKVNEPERLKLKAWEKHGHPVYGQVTTWTGDKLGNAIFGDVYRSNFGDKRASIEVTGINGRKYHGIYYCDAGDYARIKMNKNQRKG